MELRYEENINTMATGNNSPQPILIQWNANGLGYRIRLGEFERLINLYSPLCMCIQHTGKIRKDIKNYKLAKISTNNNGEYGTAIYVHNSITYDEIQINTTKLQPSAICIHIPNKGKMHILNCYNQPQFKYDMNKLKDIIKQIPHPKLVVGDFNSHSPLWDINCDKPDQGGKIIEGMLQDSQLICINEEENPTFYSKIHGTKTAIDLTICSAELQEDLEWHVLEDQFTSDHYPVLVTIQTQEDPSETTRRFRTNLADWKGFTAATENIPEFNEEIEAEEAYGIIKKVILNAAENHIPQNMGVRKKKIVPWWSKDLQQSVDLKHKMTNQIYRKRKDIDEIEKIPNMSEKQKHKIKQLEREIQKLKPERNKVEALLKKQLLRAKNDSWKKYVSKLNGQTPLKKIWKRFKKINGTQRKAPRHAITFEGRRIHDPTEMSDAFAKHLAKVSSDEFYSDKFRKHKTEKERNRIYYEEDPNNTESYNINFTPEELAAALKTSNKSAPGEDRINFEMIIHLAEKAKIYLLKLFNHLWNRGEFIKEWKTAMVIPLPKPGKDPGNISNYRPVSLTSCICKTFEKMVNMRLTWVLRDRKVISDMQFGSIKNRSTLDPITILEHHIRTGFKKHIPTVAVFYDIEKAYDSTWKYPIMEKLKDIGLKGQLPKLVQNFLTDRKFKVKIDNSTSEEQSQQNGIPQGSVLSCTLFHIAINSIVKDVSVFVKFSLYMDDFVIYCSAKRLHVAARRLNMANKEIEKWEDSSGFKMSLDKTQVVIFYRRKTWINGQDLLITLNNKPLPIVDRYKFLGVIFDSYLTWKYHIAYTKTKCRKALNLLRKLSHTTWGADRQTLRTLYRATVLPILDYGSQVYGSATRSQLARLDPIHNEGTRLISGAFRSSPVTSLHVENGDPPLDLHRDLIQMKSALRIKESDSPAKELFQVNDDYERQVPFTIRAQRLLKQTGISLRLQEKTEETPPWLLKRAEVCTGLWSLKKTENPHVLKTKALEHIAKKGSRLNIYTDGSKNEQGVGFAVITPESQVQHSLPNETSVYTAELMAIHYALDLAKNRDGMPTTIYSDSRSALEAIQDFYPKNQLVKEIQKRIDKLLREGETVSFCWIPAHVGVPGNEKADKAAKAAIQCTQARDGIPCRDYYPSLKKIIWRRWQNAWNSEPMANKLRNIKEDVNPWKQEAKERETQVLMTRLRIGHTRLTHCHLMEKPNGGIKPEPSKCNNCQVDLSIRHIFEECPQIADIRRATIGQRTMEQVLGPEAPIGRIKEFLKRIGINDTI